MTKLGYAYQGKEKDIARAIAKDVRISPKKSYEIANSIRGMNLEKAKALLQDVIERKRPIRYRRYNRGGTGHRKKSGPGRYPVETSKEFMKLLNEAGANAEFKGLNAENLVKRHIATHRGAVIPGRFKGAAHNTPTTHIEIVLAEAEKKEKEEPKAETKPATKPEVKPTAPKKEEKSEKPEKKGKK